MIGTAGGVGPLLAGSAISVIASISAMKRRRFMRPPARTNWQEGRLVAGALPVTGPALAHSVEAGLVLPVIIAAAKHESRLDPDNLRTDLEAAGLQTLGNSVGGGARGPTKK